MQIIKPFHNIVDLLDFGDLVVNAGPGKRTVTEQNLTIADSTTLMQQMSSPSSFDGALHVVPRKPVVLVADSMGDCFLHTDEVFAPTIRSSYTYEWIARDVVEGVVDLQRYSNIIIWAGAHAIHKLEMDQISMDLRGLVNVILPRNPKANVYISTLIPKPRENHITSPLFQQYNKVIQETVAQLANKCNRVYCLNSDTIFLDHNNDIVRPIIDNYLDGFHLNFMGAKKLRNHWLNNLEIAS